jgi:hypothetical protein
MLKYAELKQKPKEFLAATSLTVEEFDALVPAFEQAYATAYPSDKTMAGQTRKRTAGGGVKGRLAGIENKLLFILVYVKTYPLQTMHGLQFGLSQPQTNEWIHRLMPLLREAMNAQGLTPQRDGSQVATHPAMDVEGADLLIDGMERPRQRPKDADRQADCYSGKSKSHCDKNLIVVHEHTHQVIYLSATQPGHTHDKKMADDAQITYPDDATLTKDTGFQGYEPVNVMTYQPKKAERQAVDR